VVIQLGDRLLELTGNFLDRPTAVVIAHEKREHAEPEWVRQRLDRLGAVDLADT